MKTITIADSEAYVDEQERYLMAHDLPVALSMGFWEQAATDFPGFMLDLCYHDREAPADFIASIGACLMEDCTSTVLTPDVRLQSATESINQIT